MQIEKGDVEWLISVIIAVLMPLIQNNIKIKKPLRRRRKHK